jgi:competence protein ComEC
VTSSAHPLVWPAVALVAGIVLADRWAWPAAWALVAAGLVLAGVLAQGLWRGRIGLAWLCLGLMLLGGGLLSWQRAQPLADDHLRHLADNQPHALEAQVVGAPQPVQFGSRVLLRARSLDGQPASGLVSLNLPREQPPPAVGHLISLQARLKPLTSFANPGGFDYAQVLAAQELYVQASAGKHAGLQDLGPGPGGGLALMVEGYRQRLGLLLAGLPPGQGRALILALVLGQRGELSAAAREAFSVTGTAHLLAIAGLHLGIVWGWSFLALRLLLAAWPGLALRWPVPKLAAACALLPAWCYALVAGGSIPTTRALIMAACLVAALCADRPYRSLGALALAALLIGLAWPEAPLSVSFQLSFVSVGAILLAAVPLANWLRARQGLGRLGGGLLAWLALGAVTSLAVTPLTMLYFHSLPWLSIPANALLIPLVAMLVLPLSLLGAALGLIWPTGGAWLLGWALHPAGAAVDLASYLAGLPGAVTYLAGPGPAVVALIYAAALLVLVLPRRARWWLGGAVAGLALALGVIEAQPPPPDGKLTVWVLDVGQGSAAVVRLPQGQVLVMDAGGGRGDLDTGQRVLAPFLWSQGLRRVDYLAVSHIHPDHAGGMPFLARWLAPGQVWTSGEPAPDQHGPYARLLALAEARETPMPTLESLAGLSQLGGARMLLAWPPPGLDLEELSENDRSLWLGLGLGNTWIWLPGDAGPKVEKAVAPDLPRGGRQILVAPHHGGKDSCTQELLEHLTPLAVVYSAGCGNSFGMPRADSRARAASVGARAYTTIGQGCLKLVSDGQDWRVVPYLDPPRDCALPGGVPAAGP